MADCVCDPLTCLRYLPASARVFVPNLQRQRVCSGYIPCGEGSEGRRPVSEMVLGHRNGTEVPDWSGEFWVDDDGGFAYMSVHIRDQRTHRPPDDSWRLSRTYASAEEEAQVFIYRKVCPDYCVCCSGISQ